MAYPNTQYEVLMTATAVSATATGDVGEWMPAYLPHVIRGVAIIPTTTGGTYGSLNVTFNHLDMASGSTASAIDVIYAVSSDKPGHVIYAKTNVVINPGEKVVCNVSAAATSTAANFKAVLYVEPKWDVPGNNTGMRVTT